MRILVTGAAGSGTTTLAAALAGDLHCPHIEADDFFWLPTVPPYRERRALKERHEMFFEALRAGNPCVIAGSIMGWGFDELLDIVVFRYLRTDVRLQRLREREIARFGSVDQGFLDWAAQYDAGPREGRSLAQHQASLATLHCPVLRLCEDLPVADLLTQVRRFLAETAK